MFFILISCSFNSSNIEDNLHFLHINIHNSNNEPIHNASVWVSDLMAPNYYSTDSSGLIKIPLLMKMTEIKISHSKYKTPELIYNIPYPSRKIDTLIVKLTLKDKKLLFFNFEDIGSSEIEQPEELKYYSTEEIEKLTDHNLNEKFTVIDNVKLNNQIKSVSDLLNYNPINDLEKMLIDSSGSILYPILCYKNKAIVTVRGGSWSTTYIVKFEESEIKYLVIGGWIS